MIEHVEVGFALRSSNHSTLFQQHGLNGARSDEAGGVKVKAEQASESSCVGIDDGPGVAERLQKCANGRDLVGSYDLVLHGGAGLDVIVENVLEIVGLSTSGSSDKDHGLVFSGCDHVFVRQGGHGEDVWRHVFDFAFFEH